MGNRIEQKTKNYIDKVKKINEDLFLRNGRRQAVEIVTYGCPYVLVYTMNSGSKYADS